MPVAICLTGFEVCPRQVILVSALMAFHCLLCWLLSGRRLPLFPVPRDVQEEGDARPSRTNTSSGPFPPLLQISLTTADRVLDTSLGQGQGM